MNLSTPPAKEKIVSTEGLGTWQWIKWFDVLYKAVAKVSLSQDAAPTSGNWVKGDFVRNSDPSESGSVGSKYIIIGWICTVSGAPGTWLEARVLTGN